MIDVSRGPLISQWLRSAFSLTLVDLAWVAAFSLSFIYRRRRPLNILSVLCIERDRPHSKINLFLPPNLFFSSSQVFTQLATASTCVSHQSYFHQ